jgi:hypothetical protein
MVWVVAYLAFSTFLVAGAWPYLANFPPVSADEVWIMSASVTLADEGVLGSDLFAGFHGADRHYFLNLPAHHFFQAAFFKVFGAGVAPARAPSLVAGVVVLWAVGWLAYKWVGVECSLATGILLLFWRSNLIAPDPRPPLLALAQSGRYDITVLSGWWLTMVVFARHLDQPRRITAIVSGLLGGITALTQHYGVGALVACAATLLWMQRQERHRSLYARDVAIGALMPIAVYALYVAIYWTDFVGQVAIHAQRLHFNDPRFYLTNLLNEWRRFEWLIGTSGDAVRGWTIVPAIAATFFVIARLGRGGNGLAFMSVLAAFLSLALLESLKARLYASLLVPVLCFGLAAALAPATAASRRGFATALRAVAVWLLLIALVVDGFAGYRFVSNEGPRVSSYVDAGRRMAMSLDPEVTVLGSQRWWWPLRAFPYRSLSAQWEIWKVEEGANHKPEFNAMLERLGAGYLIVDDDIRGDLTRMPPQLRQQVDDVLRSRAKKIEAWRDPTYGLIEIHRF